MTRIAATVALPEMSFDLCPSELKARLQGEAEILGFDLFGVAAAGEAAGRSRLESWLDAGMHGEMSWMAKSSALRADVRTLMPECRSVIVVAMSYRHEHADSSSTEPGRAWISRYAWGRDYHKFLKKKLLRLGHLAVELAGPHVWRAFVDTGPVQERDWAAQAGLGWIGKNACLLNRQFGSELFLGVLLSQLDLPADRPTTEHCGKCTACLDACPTEAFVEPGIVDSRRCIAYLTIEHRGEIEAELASAMGHHVAGCDICQEVCPWTRRAPDGHPDFAPAAHRDSPSLDALEALDEDGFLQWRQGSALKRITYPAWRRNLAIARANLNAAERATEPSQLQSPAKRELVADEEL